MKKGLVPGGAIFMGLIVSLAILGIGYGLWSDTLRISGAVATGNVNAAFSLHEVDQGLVRGAPGGPADNDVNEHLEQGGLHVTDCYVRIYSPTTDGQQATDTNETDDLVATRPSDFMFVLIKNGYPSFNCYVDFDVHNVGTIPIKVKRPALGPIPDPRILTVEFQSCYDDGAQVEPGKEVRCSLHVHIERGAAQNSLYRFGATICAYQWNATGPVRCIMPAEVEPVPADLGPGDPVPVTPLGIRP